jgi:hypothetical protein
MSVRKQSAYRHFSLRSFQYRLAETPEKWLRCASCSLAVQLKLAKPVCRYSLLSPETDGNIAALPSMECALLRCLCNYSKRALRKENGGGETQQLTDDSR